MIKTFADQNIRNNLLRQTNIENFKDLMKKARSFMPKSEFQTWHMYRIKNDKKTSGN